ncbi:MAG TPA: cyclic nucleotide-binding domain-containing protein [Fimbriimonadaceae bacterium]|nr:cyclic nucleotide-binding domain-containing protein [Fimbriimonadaceae bacterium]
MWDVIRVSYLAQGLSDEDVDKIVEIARELTFSNGQYVVRADDDNHDLYIVLEGVTSIETPSGEVIAKVGSGRLIGEVALIDDKPRSATVVSLGRSRLAALPADDLRRLMSERPIMAVGILTNIARTLSERLRQANLQIESLLDLD